MVSCDIIYYSERVEDNPKKPRKGKCKMNILSVRVCQSYILVTYLRKDGWTMKKKYFVASDRVFDFISSHDCIFLHNGDYLYR